MNGIKIVTGSDVQNAKPREFSVNSDIPLWICDLKKKPKHFGLLKASIASIAPFSQRTLLSVTHGYMKTPSFITEWNYPAGTSPLLGTNQTYGIGSLEAFTAGGLMTYRAILSPTQFKIIADNTSNSGTVTNQYVEFRYYIFAPPLGEPLDSQ
jgi:hypothetical protein